MTKSDPCPKSAVSHGVGLAGLAGLALWTLVARHYGMDGPNAGLTAVVACGLPMVLWSLHVEQAEGVGARLGQHAPLRQANHVVAQRRALAGPGLQTPLTLKRL